MEYIINTNNLLESWVLIVNIAENGHWKVNIIRKKRKEIKISMKNRHNHCRYALNGKYVDISGSKNTGLLVSYGRS